MVTTVRTNTSSFLDLQFLTISFRKIKFVFRKERKGIGQDQAYVRLLNGTEYNKILVARNRFHQKIMAAFKPRSPWGGKCTRLLLPFSGVTVFKEVSISKPTFPFNASNLIKVGCIVRAPVDKAA